MSIQVNNLLKIYGSQKAVNEISFTVQRGEIVGFLGPNGAGKSTTMKILTGYLPATAGEAYVCDIPVAVNPLAARKKIGYLPELNALYYDMYVREYLGFVADVHQLPNKKAAIEKAIETVGLQVEARKKIGQLSKGYKQRVGLAAALIHDPEVLILDEPTTGLDPNQIIEIREVIRSQGKTKTVLFSSHILQEVEAICDRVIIISKGQLVANDTLSNLKQKQQGTHTVQVQFKEDVKPEQFSAIPAIGSIEAIPGIQGSFRIQTTNPEAVRKSLLSFAVDNNLNIVTLQSEEQKLEDIFRELTGDRGSMIGDR
ncbi:MAG: gliding motility-associated ABC transporter ATP-binding subunit GldA [Chitinophagaceae bacterium]|nr:gliding motility-associated ABC transporter ATP-binding subunit GldA [Chitinophagaceae bacterium]